MLEATWLSCCVTGAGTEGVRSRVTSVVIPSVLSGLQGCAKSVLKWEITRDSPDAAQRFASDLVNGNLSACELIQDQSAAVVFFQIQQSRSPVCSLSIHYSICFKKECQSQLWCGGGNWAWAAKSCSFKSPFVQLIVPFSSPPVNGLGGITAVFSSWRIPGLCVCMQGDCSLLDALKAKRGFGGNPISCFELAAWSGASCFPHNLKICF